MTGTHAYNGCIATKTIEVLSNNIPFGLQGIAPTNSTSCNGTVHIISQVYEGYTVSASTGSLNGTTVTNLCYGWLKVCLTNTATNCTKCDSILINGATFLDEVQAGPSLLIYPNPAAGNVRISSSSSRRVALELRDVSGRMVLSAEMEKELDLDISTLSAGTYFISLREGDRRVYRKLLVSAP